MEDVAIMLTNLLTEQ